MIGPVLVPRSLGVPPSLAHWWGEKEGGGSIHGCMLLDVHVLQPKCQFSIVPEFLHCAIDSYQHDCQFQETEVQSPEHRSQGQKMSSLNVGLVGVHRRERDPVAIIGIRAMLVDLERYHTCLLMVEEAGNDQAKSLTGGRRTGGPMMRLLSLQRKCEGQAKQLQKGRLKELGNIL
ncbi:hypothetical protein NDU88_002585 [Pleurodeles waltl]|uniref:Uncharacterized protein n=1 Tax=Pleurodeles waltl TaxID=8319 RepID=A0AAV7W125_PLEWA|nr:hypothetical protein NDU88_002585 [Pleurodeles waltl]